MSTPTPSTPPASAPAPIADPMTPTDGSSKSGGIMSTVGGFFEGIVNNFTGENSTGTGIGAIVGTVALAGIGFMMGGLPGILIGGLLGAAGGGLMNEVASWAMEQMGIAPDVRTMGGNVPRAKADGKLADVRALDVSQPGRDAVETSTVAPRPENFKDMENLSDQINSRRAGGVDLGTAMVNEIQDIRSMAPGRERTRRMKQFWEDRNHSIQFMEDVGRWNELSTQWKEGDRIRLVEANKEMAGGLALPELEVPDALIFDKASNLKEIPGSLVREVTGGSPNALASFNKKSRMEQLQDVYEHIDGELNGVDLHALAERAKPGGLFGGRSWGRIGNSAVNVVSHYSEEAGLNPFDDDGDIAKRISHLGNSTDAVHQIARITELSPNAAADIKGSGLLAKTAREGLRMLENENDGSDNAAAKRRLFEATLESVRLEKLRDRADTYLSSYMSASEEGYNQLVKRGEFEGYVARVEDLRSQVNQRNGRVEELNQAKLRFVERGGPDDNNKWVTMQDDSVNPPKKVTYVAEKKGADWVVTHAYGGEHDAAKDTAADTAIPPLKMADIFTPEGVMNTKNIGQTIRESIVRISAATDLGLTSTAPTVAKTTDLAPGTAVAPAAAGPTTGTTTPAAGVPGP